jgi:hypothetical protein
LEELIAKLEVIGITKDGRKIDIVASVGKPYLVGGNEDNDEWACPVSLVPLYTKLHDAHGSGSFQALCLANNLIIDLLRGFKEKGGELVCGDGAEFPLEAYWFGKNAST